MSHLVRNLVQGRVVGSATRKSILLFMADIAADDGGGIWRSKANMASLLELGRRTVQENLDALAEDGLIVETGRRKCTHGYTIEYRIDLEAIARLEAVKLQRERRGEEPADVREPHALTRAGAAPVRQPHPTRAAAAPQDVRQPHITHPRTILEPSLLDHRADDPGPRFAEFWAAWPNKVGRAKAEQAWKRLKPVDRRAALDRVEEWWRLWTSRYPQASPLHPTTFLNGRRWQDDFGSSAPVVTSPSRIEKYRRIP